MAKLYLHIGCAKTGSSFLQSTFAWNRKLLKDHGFFFPEGTRESDLINGKISPGNGAELTDSLNARDFKNAASLLSSFSRLALQENCEKILLSNENLIKPLVKRETLKKFLELARDAGFEEIKSLVVVREPVDHVLSFYKHRAKNGNWPDFKKWFDTFYYLPDVLNQMQEVIEYPGMRWTIKKYTSNSRDLLEKIYTGWLKVPTEKVSVKSQKVNPSLTLSEIRYLQNLRESHPDLTGILSNALVQIPKNKKANDRTLENQFRAQAKSFLSSKQGSFTNLNKYLEKNDLDRFEPLESRQEFPGAQNSGTEETYCFSKDQLQCITKIMKPSNTLKSIYFKLKRKVRLK